MIPAKRQTMIYDEIKEKGTISIQELAALTGASAMTIRRDLEKLEEEGLLVRSYGGAQLTGDVLNKEVNYSQKQQENIDAKKRIAAEAAKLVKPGQILLLDAGTTTYQVALLLKGIEELTIITPDVKIAAELCDSDARVIILGGEIQNETKSVFSADNLDYVKSINYDIAFIGTSNISTDLMMCTPTYEKARFKKEFIKNAGKSVLLADSSKFYSKSVFKICSLNHLDEIITDKQFSKEEKEQLTGAGVAGDAIKQV